MKDDGRALTEEDVRGIQRDIFLGLYNDRHLDRIIQTIDVQRRVLKILFSKFAYVPLRLYSVADPIRNSELAHLKELVALEDPRPEIP